MTFHPNHIFLYIIAVIVILFVLVQSVFFLVRAYRRGKAIGMDKRKLNKTILSTALFTLAPAVAILIGVLSLSQSLGIPLPWVRMSVIGALTYEVPAANAALEAISGQEQNVQEITTLVTNAKDFAAVAWVMTLGIMPSIILPPFLMKKIRGGMLKIKNKDQKWGDVFMASLFLGMISAFLGLVFANVRAGLVGWIPCFVMLVSAACMAVCGLLIKKCGWKWLENYAMAICILVGMAFAAVITPVIGG